MNNAFFWNNSLGSPCSSSPSKKELYCSLVYLLKLFLSAVYSCLQNITWKFFYITDHSPTFYFWWALQNKQLDNRLTRSVSEWCSYIWIPTGLLAKVTSDIDMSEYAWNTRWNYKTWAHFSSTFYINNDREICLIKIPHVVILKYIRFS